MDTIPLLVLIFYSIPESILIFTFGFVIFGVKIDANKIFIAAIISAFTSYLVRMLPLPFGFHTIIGVLVLTSLFRYLCKFGFGYSLLATLFSLSTLMGLETIFANLLQNYLHMSIKDLLQKSPIFKTLSYYPVLIGWTFITLFIRKKFPGGVLEWTKII